MTDRKKHFVIIEDDSITKNNILLSIYAAEKLCEHTAITQDMIMDVLWRSKQITADQIREDMQRGETAFTASEFISGDEVVEHLGNVPRESLELIIIDGNLSMRNVGNMGFPERNKKIKGISDIQDGPTLVQAILSAYPEIKSKLVAASHMSDYMRDMYIFGAEKGLYQKGGLIEDAQNIHQRLREAHPEQ